MERVLRFLADHDVTYNGLSGFWEAHYDSGCRCYEDIRELVKGELLTWFLPIYGLKWDDIEKLHRLKRVNENNPGENRHRTIELYLCSTK